MRVKFLTITVRFTPVLVRTSSPGSLVLRLVAPHIAPPFDLLRSQKCLFVNLVDQTIFLRLNGIHEEVAVCILLDL